MKSRAINERELCMWTRFRYLKGDGQVASCLYEGNLPVRFALVNAYFIKTCSLVIKRGSSLQYSHLYGSNRLSEAFLRG